MKAILRAPGLCDRGLSPDPPILTLPQPPSPAVWVNGEARNGEEILHVTPPTYPPTIGGLLTIPNPRLCPPSNPPTKPYSTKGWKCPCNTSSHPTTTFASKILNICLQEAISNFQWKLISFFQCRRPQRQCLGEKGIEENLILCLTAQNSAKILFRTVGQKPRARI